MKSRQFFILSALALAASLTACGGGGGGTAVVPTASAPATLTTPVATPVATTVAVATVDSTIVTAVTAASYTPGSEEAAAFNRLNAERSQCGFGLLTQSVQLDAAAKSHNDFQIINGTASHFENQAQFPNGFTGTYPLDRAVAKGYIDSGYVADDFSILSGTTSKTGFGDIGTHSLLSAPYHLAGLMDGNKDVGISVRSSNETTPIGANTDVYLHFNSSFKTAVGKQLIAANSVQTYPCQGSVNINRQLQNETPNPVPGRDLFVNPIGTPIYITTRDGDTLTIATTSLKETISNTSVVLRPTISSSNDPNGIYKTNTGYTAPDAPLKALTQYTVILTGTANNVAFTKTFSFTTGT